MEAEWIVEKLHAGELEAARKQLTTLLKSGQDEELFIVAEELLSLGFLEEAKQVYSTLYHRYPDESILALGLAEIHLEEDEEEEAILLLEKILPDDENYPSSLLLLADCYEAAGMTEVSEAKLIEAHRILPNHPVVQFALAEIYFAHHKYQEALRLYEKLTVPEVNGVTKAERIAEVLVSIGQFEQALPAFEQAAKTVHDSSFLFQYGLAAYSAGEYVLAKRQFLHVLEHDPDFQGIHLNLAKSFEQLEDLSEALKTIRQGMKVDPYYKEQFLYAAQLLLRLGKGEEAIQILQETIAIDNTYLEAIHLLAKIYLQQEDYSAVVDLIQAVQAANETDPAFDWFLATAERGLEKFSIAAQYYREASEHFQTDAAFLEEYAYFLLEEGQLTEAKLIFEKLLGMEPSNSEYIDVLERM